MLMEHYILIALWLIGIAIFMLFIPRTHLREALLSLMVFQAVIWLFNIPAFLFGLVSAPIREFPKAHDLPITLNYFFYPVLFSVYYVNFRLKWVGWLKWLIVWVSGAAFMDVVIEQYTDLLEYGLMTWYGIWLYIGWLFLVSQFLCDWFYKVKISRGK